ncbi:MAG: peptide ABC transporter substrate-binding protein [Candidatus Latescibacteria bacterium]|nr:peptide ABC transporter substrate-binding protein [Candidatus Latescibacterota bacterium]
MRLIRLYLLAASFAVSIPPTSAQLVNAIGKRLPSDAAPLSKQVFRYIIPEPQTLDVNVRMYGSPGGFIFEPLLVVDPLTNQILPGVADRYDRSKDGRVWTFHLRKGGKWSDGRPATAHDFVYSWRRALDPKEANPYAFFYYDIKGAKEFNTGLSKDPNTVKIRAADDLTFVVETANPCPYFPYIAAYGGTPPVPRWQIEKYGQRWTETGKCVSNATYKLERWIPGDRIILTLDPMYNGPNKGSLEKIIWVLQPVGAKVGLLAYENNEIDLYNVDSIELARVEKDPVLRAQLVKVPIPRTRYIVVQTTKPPFTDVRVRRGLAHAIDRDAIIKTVLRGAGTPAYMMLPHDYPGYLGDKYKALQGYNPALAKKLFAEAGYPGGKGFPKKELWVRESAASVRAVAEAIQAMWKSVLGIDVTIRNQEEKTFMDNMYQHTIPLGLVPFTSDYPDPHSMLGSLWHSQPPGHGRHPWKNARFDTFVEQAARELDPARRMGMYEEAQKILADDVGGLFIYHDVSLELRKPFLRGIKTSPSGYPILPRLSELYIGR